MQIRAGRAQCSTSQRLSITFTTTSAFRPSCVGCVDSEVLVLSAVDSAIEPTCSGLTVPRHGPPSAMIAGATYGSAHRGPGRGTAAAREKAAVLAFNHVQRAA